MLKDQEGTAAAALDEHRRSTQTLAGLRAKRQEAQAKVRQLEEQTPIVFEQYLRGQVASEAERYLAVSEDLVASLQRVYALDGLLQRVTGSRSPEYLGRSLNDTLIPSVKAPCFDGVQHHDEALRVLFSGAHHKAFPSELVESECEVLRGYGLTEFV